MMERWKRWDAFISRVESYCLTLLLSLMMLTAFTQIVLRNLFSTGLTWGDPLVRYLVLWLGFIGASLATREGKHIQIDVASHWLSGRGKRVTAVCTDFVSAAICVVMAYAAFTFIRIEAQLGETLFFSIPSWAAEIILPLAFTLMALRFAFNGLAAAIGWPSALDADGGGTP